VREEGPAIRVDEAVPLGGVDLADAVRELERKTC